MSDQGRKVCRVDGARSGKGIESLFMPDEDSSTLDDPLIVASAEEIAVRNRNAEQYTVCARIDRLEREDRRLAIIGYVSLLLLFFGVILPYFWGAGPHWGTAWRQIVENLAR